MNNAISVVFIIALVIGLVIIIPLGAIWAFNTLFGTVIAFTLKNWFAAFILTSVVSGSKVNKSS